MTVTGESPTPTTRRAPRVDPFAAALAMIVVLGLAIRLVMALPRADPSYLTDANFFRLQAVLLAQGHGFADPFVWINEHRLVPTAFHPPLFSMFLGSVHWLGFESVAAARVASCLLGTTTVLIVGFVGREVGGPRVGLVAAGIAAITPNLWVPDGVFGSETLAATLVAATLWFSYRLVRRPRYGTAIGLGIMIGLAGLTRPETLAFSAILVIPLARHLAVSTRIRIGLVAVAGLATLVVIAPWLVRSATIFDRPVLFSTNGLALFGVANCPSTYQGQSLGSWTMKCPRENGGLGRTPTADNDDDDDEAMIASNLATHGLRFFDRHTGEFLTTVMWARIGRTWSVFHPFAVQESREYEGKTRNQMVVGVLVLWSSMVLGVGGVVALVRARTVPVWPLLAPLVVATVISVLAYGTPRFRVIAEPSIAILAALGVDAMLRSRSRTAVTNAAPNRTAPDE